MTLFHGSCGLQTAIENLRDQLGIVLYCFQYILNP